MDCAYCTDSVDKQTGYFELDHHQSGSDPVLQHTFCSSECLREHLAG